MTTPADIPDLAPGPVHEYRLRVQARPLWHAELQDLSMSHDQPPLQFDNPLELAHHLAGPTTTRTGLR